MTENWRRSGHPDAFHGCQFWGDKFFWTYEVFQGSFANQKVSNINVLKNHKCFSFFNSLIFAVRYFLIDVYFSLLYSVILHLILCSKVLLVPQVIILLFSHIQNWYLRWQTTCSCSSIIVRECSTWMAWIDHQRITNFQNDSSSLYQWSCLNWSPIEKQSNE